MRVVFLSKCKVLQGNHDLVNPSLIRGLLQIQCEYDLGSFSKPNLSMADHYHLPDKYTPQ